jgi:hypothetical protein
VTPCKQGCGLEVRWVKDGKRWRCLNADGSDHWDLCSKTRTERAKAEGVPFKKTDGEGVTWQDKDRYLHRQSKVITGDLYKPTCGECDLPPWEACACSAFLNQSKGVANGNRKQT